MGDQWAASSDHIALTPDGGAATNSQHKVYFPASINTTGGIHLVTPHGDHLHSTVLGLKLFDMATGSNAVIAEVQDSIGQLLQSSNQVIYTNALMDTLSDFQADVLYTQKRSGFEQDVILRRQLPSPTVLGFNPHTTLLQVWTEFFDPPEPSIRTNMVGMPVRGQRHHDRRRMANHTLNFDSMQMGSGNAFFVGGVTNGSSQGTNGNVAVPVAKEWVHQDGRTFLIEKVLFDSIVQQTSALPPSASISKPTNSTARQASFRRPATSAQRHARSQSLQLAQLNPNAQPGFLLDYATVNDDLTNYVFQSDTTYYVSDTTYLYGTNNVLEGGTVIKCAPFPGSANLWLTEGDIVCQTGPYRPAIFTCPDDDSVGQPLSGSSGVPSLSVNCFLNLPLGGNVHDLRFCYSYDACAAGAEDVEFRDCQFINCAEAMGTYDTTATLGVHNVLVEMQDSIDSPANSGSVASAAISCLGGTLAISCDHLTADMGSQNFVVFYADVDDPSNCPINVTNSIILSPLIDPYGWRGDLVGITIGTNMVYSASTNPGTLFQTVGAANYYLAPDSPCQGAGVTNIDPVSLADIRQKTTYPPVILTNTFTTDIVLTREAQRDTNSFPDLGYHYDPIDFLSSCLVSNAVLTLTNGVVLGYGMISLGPPWGVWLEDGSQLVSQGKAGQMNYMVHLNLVQEQNWPYDITGGRSFCPAPTHLDQRPSVDMEFTTISCQNYGVALMNMFDGGGETVSSMTLSDCELYACGAYLWMNTSSDNPVITVKNNLFHRSPDIELVTPAQLTAYNNLFYGSPTALTSVLLEYSGGSVSATNKNNAFDNCDVTMSGVYSNNAYLNATAWEMTAETNAIITNLAWVIGPLGYFYQPTGSPLINMGNTSSSNVGMYHFTTQVGQAPETNSIVDIGYHYIALGTNGLPLDTDGDGLPDYLEDSNGDGLTNFLTDLGNWTNSTTCLGGMSDGIRYAQGQNLHICTISNDASGILFLQVYTPLK